MEALVGGWLKMDMTFYRGKNVLVTGHTGFKGSWMCKLLIQLGANVTGYALEPPTSPSLFELVHLSDRMNSVIGDVRDYLHLKSVFDTIKPEIVIHMAAQPIVRESYKHPRYTYETNVMGTVNLLECARLCDSVKSIINVTTDKVYHNREWNWGYRENEELNGYDPYSNSKSCSELVTSSYRNAFFREKNIAVSTVRAGNVIGGGDFAVDRIIPDCVRALSQKGNICVRNPKSIRPYQHVLEPIMVYLMIAEAQYKKPELADCYNVGPDDDDCITTGELVSLFCNEWKDITGVDVTWSTEDKDGPHEANFLKLDCSKLKDSFEWKMHWHIKETISKIVEWSYEYLTGGDVEECMDRQIEQYMSVRGVR